MDSDFDLEQVCLLNEVDEICNKCLGPKRTGYEVCIMITKYIHSHLPANYKVAGPNSYVDDISTEFDLLIVRAEAQPRGVAYEPRDVQVVLEIKTSGIKENIAKYPLEIAKIRKKFDKVGMKNTKTWGAVLMCYGTIHPRRPTSHDYRAIRKNGLEPYGYGEYTLADVRTDELESGEWGKFIKNLIERL
ncbi:MAG: hypothetical protein WB564_01420 [Dehalococcoidia bacterium]